MPHSLGSFQERFPQDERGIYNKYYGKLLKYHEDLIKKVLRCAGPETKFPVGTELFELYLTGYRIQYVPFNNREIPGLEGVEGFWSIDDNDAGLLYVFYNTNTSVNRQLYTKIHETIHICQFLDDEFTLFLDEIILDGSLSAETIDRLVNRITERSTAMYLMPEQAFVQKFHEVGKVIDVASYFRVSVRSALFRMEECGLGVPG